MDQRYNIAGFSVASIRNRNELRAAKMMQELLPRLPDFCGCRLCIEDVYAATLNQIPAHYVQTGAMVLRPPPPSNGELEQAIREAVVKVNKRPNHA